MQSPQDPMRGMGMIVLNKVFRNAMSGKGGPLEGLHEIAALIFSRASFDQNDVGYF